MSIVFITIPGHQKRMFANDLHKQTNSSVAFVIVQKTRRVPFQERFQKLLKTVGWKNILKEFYFVIYIRFNGIS